MTRYTTITIHCETADCPSRLVLATPTERDPAPATLRQCLELLGWVVTQGTARDYHRCPGCGGAR